MFPSGMDMGKVFGAMGTHMTLMDTVFKKADAVVEIWRDKGQGAEMETAVREMAEALLAYKAFDPAKAFLGTDDEPET